MSLVSQYTCLFSDVPTCTNVLRHDMEVKETRPIKLINQTKGEMMKKEADDLLQNGLAKVSASPWSSSCLLVAKSDGSPWFISDFRKVLFEIPTFCLEWRIVWITWEQPSL